MKLSKARPSGGDLEKGDDATWLQERSEAGSSAPGASKASGTKPPGSYWRGGYELVDYHAAPLYLKGNEFILKYYRADWPFHVAFCSLFDLHNETLNIWTHLLGFFLFLWLTVDTLKREWPPFPSQPHGSSMFDRRQEAGGSWLGLATGTATGGAAAAARLPKWPLLVFLGGAMACLLCSSAAHLLHCQSHHVSRCMWKVDFCGITALIATSFVPPIFYGFLCQPLWQVFYLAVTAVLSLMTMGVALAPNFGAPAYRSVRAAIFASLGLSGVVPCVHKVIVLWGDPMVLPSTLMEVSMGAIYGAGAALYVLRVPERWHPGKYDLVGHSHQIMHIAVVLGAWLHYHTGLFYLHWRNSLGCPPP